MAYTTVQAVREMAPMHDTDAFPEQSIVDAIALAKEDIDRFTGTTWGNIDTPAFDSFDVEIERMAGCQMQLRDIEGRAVMFPRTVTTATHETEGVIDATGWRLDRTGRITDTNGTAPTGWITIVGTAGRTDTPDTTIEWAARTLARNHLINEASKLPDRALSQETELGGTIRLAQPGMVNPTGLPAVDARLKRYRHQFGPVF